MVILNCFADKPPRNSTFPKYTNPNPELTVGAVLKLFYFWFDPVAVKGYRRPLVESDIYDINPENASAHLVPKFDKNFNKSVKKSQQKKERKNSKSSEENAKQDTTGDGSVLFALTRSFMGPFLFALGLRFSIDLLQFGLPLILRALINYVGTDEPGVLWKGLVLTFGLFSISFVMAILNGHHNILAYRFGYLIRTSLISAVYRKALRLSSVAKRSTTMGEIVNLMSIDANRFVDMSPCIMLLLSFPFTLGLTIFMLYKILNVAVFSGMAVLIVLFPISGFIANKIKNLQQCQMKLKDERIKLTNEILNGIKVLKLYAWEESFEAQVEAIRGKEIKVLRKSAIFQAFSEVLWNTAPFLMSFTSFVTWVLLGNELTPTIAFVSIALFNIMRIPMMFCE